MSESFKHTFQTRDSGPQSNRNASHCISSFLCSSLQKQRILVFTCGPCLTSEQAGAAERRDPTSKTGEACITDEMSEDAVLEGKRKRNKGQSLKGGGGEVPGGSRFELLNFNEKTSKTQTMQWILTGLITEKEYAGFSKSKRV